MDANTFREPSDGAMFGPNLDEDEKEQENENQDQDTENEDDSYYLGEEDSILPQRPPSLSKAELAALRLQLVKEAQELDALQRKAERSKPALDTLEPTEEEFQKHADKLGFAIGQICWGRYRAAKEIVNLKKIVFAMGEAFDHSVALSGIRFMVTGFRRAQKQFHFSSVAKNVTKDTDSDLGQLIWAEMSEVMPDHYLQSLIEKGQADPWE